MPYLAIVHLRELRCAACKSELARPGARSFVVAIDGEPAVFPPDAVPEEMHVEIRCPNGHATELLVPSDVSAEEALATPDDAPIARDAIFLA